jgi:hypothetical protein
VKNKSNSRYARSYIPRKIIIPTNTKYEEEPELHNTEANGCKKSGLPGSEGADDPRDHSGSSLKGTDKSLERGPRR